MNEIRKSNRSTFNRVQSIIEDSEFVTSVYETYKKPLVPNKRCGLWYVKPEDRQSESYFKSTDGHTGQWSFSLKRLNLHLLPLIEEFGGIIIVDSTRRGKTMPDALSKTIPIWCAVLNYALFGDTKYRFPSNCVSASEQDLVRSKIPQWAEQLRTQVPPSLLPSLSKPLRPMWTTPNEPLPMYEFKAQEPIFSDAHAVILCTASRKAQDGQDWCSSGYSYVQGAADDHELWAPAEFTSEILWEAPELRKPGLGDDELRRRIESAVAANKIRENTMDKPAKVVAVHPHISIMHSLIPSPPSQGIIIDLRSGETKIGPNHWPLAPGKRGSKQLGYVLPEICQYYEENMSDQVTIVSDPGTDFAECIALMLACRYFEPDGKFRTDGRALYVAKDEVNRRNLMIIAQSGLAPSRTTQNIIGSFLRK